MTLKKKQSKNIFNKYKYFVFLFISPISFMSYQSIAQESYKLNDMEINRSNSLDEENNFDFPTNPFEIVDRLRKANSMNDATKPSEAIDNALKSFDMINEEK